MRVANAAMLAALLASGAGCGLDVMLTGGEHAQLGETVTYQVKLTNTSACPLHGSPGDPAFAFLPMLPASLIDGELAMLCGLDGTAPAMSPQLAQTTSFEVDAATQMLQTIAEQATDVTCSGTGVTCGPFDGIPGFTACEVGDFAPGEMRQLTCTATADTAGQLFNLAIAFEPALGVCKAGPGQGQSCEIDSDCGVGGVCGSGICVDGSNAGNGCSVAGECPGGDCVDCDAGSGVGFVCTQTVVQGVAGAPAMSGWGLLAGVLALSTVAAIMLRRRASAPPC